MLVPWTRSERFGLMRAVWGRRKRVGAPSSHSSRRGSWWPQELRQPKRTRVPHINGFLIEVKRRTLSREPMGSRWRVLRRAHCPPMVLTRIVRVRKQLQESGV